MNKFIRCLLLALLAATWGYAQDTSLPTTEPRAYKVGGTPVVILSPAKDLVEVGDDKRPMMENFVPASNRLLAAFVLTDDLPRLAKDATGLGMERYALVEVARRNEDADFEASDFNAVVDTLKTQFGDIVSSTRSDVEDEFNNRMKALHLDEATVSLGKPIQLGCTFSKPDGYGFGLIVPVTRGSATMNMAMGGAVMRARKRLLFVYLYAEYKNEETIKWLRVTSEAWVDAILGANP